MHSVRIQRKNTMGYSMNTQQKYTISEATALLGFKSRSTINKRTKGQGSDSLSCEMDENGNKVISIIELERVFPDKLKAALKKGKDTANTSAEYSTKAQPNTPKNTANTMVLQHKVETLEELLSEEKAERLRERQEFKDREAKSEVREADYREHVRDLVKTVSEQTKLLEYKAEEEKEAKNEPDLPVQAANENLGDGVGENPQKASKGKNLAVFAGAIAVLFIALFLGAVFGPEIQSLYNGVGGLNALNPASGAPQ